MAFVTVNMQRSKSANHLSSRRDAGVQASCPAQKEFSATDEVNCHQDPHVNGMVTSSGPSDTVLFGQGPSQSVSDQGQKLEQPGPVPRGETVERPENPREASHDRRHASSPEATGSASSNQYGSVEGSNERELGHVIVEAQPDEGQNELDASGASEDSGEPSRVLDSSSSEESDSSRAGPDYQPSTSDGSTSDSYEYLSSSELETDEDITSGADCSSSSESVDLNELCGYLRKRARKM